MAEKLFFFAELDEKTFLAVLQYSAIFLSYSPLRKARTSTNFWVLRWI